MLKPTIPALPTSSTEHGRVMFDKTVKETLELITGKRGERVKRLHADASAPDIINKINELIALLQ